MSYPLYIFHPQMMLIVDSELHWGQFGTSGLYFHFALLAAAALLLSGLVAFLFDQPVQRLLLRFTARVWRRSNPPALAGSTYSPAPCP